MIVADIKALGFDIPNATSTDFITIEAGIKWVLNNTTLTFEYDTAEKCKNIPVEVKLFLHKWYELYSADRSVSSESIQGLSQSFNTGNMSDMAWQLAEELLSDHLKGRVRFVGAVKRW